MPELTSEALQSAIMAMPDKTGRGLDWWEPAVLKSLPHQGLASLLDLYRRVESHALWPPQLLSVMVALLPKADVSSDRPIALLPTLCR
eukprot:13698476-Alexandrium_andersonii.AAC.1